MSLTLGKGLLGRVMGSVPAPVIASLDHDLGDTLGGETIILTGTAFTGTSAVKFGATNATSYVVDSATQITAVAPAHAAGSGDVTVTTSGGISNASAYEFWSPAVGSPNCFFDTGGFAIVGSDGTWTMRSRTTAAADRYHSGSGTPDDAGGYPDFVRANSDRLSNGVTMMSLAQAFGTGDMTILAVLDIDSITAQPGVFVFENDAIVTDISGYLGLHLGGATKDKAIFWYFDLAIRSVSLTIGADPVSGRMVLACKKESGALKITKDGSSYTTGSTGVGSLGAVGTPEVILGGALYDSPQKFFDGRMKAVILDSVAWSDANITKFYKWAAVRYP